MHLGRGRVWFLGLLGSLDVYLHIHVDYRLLGDWRECDWLGKVLHVHLLLLCRSEASRRRAHQSRRGHHRRGIRATRDSGWSPVGPGAQSETASGPRAPHPWPRSPCTPARGAPVARVREGEHHSTTKCPLEHALSRAPKVVPRHARTTRCRGKRIRAISKSGGGSIIGSFSRCTTFIT